MCSEAGIGSCFDTTINRQSQHQQIGCVATVSIQKLNNTDPKPRIWKTFQRKTKENTPRKHTKAQENAKKTHQDENKQSAKSSDHQRTWCRESRRRRTWCRGHGVKVHNVHRGITVGSVMTAVTTWHQQSGESKCIIRSSQRKPRSSGSTSHRSTVVHSQRGQGVT